MVLCPNCGTVLENRFVDRAPQCRCGSFTGSSGSGYTLWAGSCNLDFYPDFAEGKRLELQWDDGSGEMMGQDVLESELEDLLPELLVRYVLES